MKRRTAATASKKARKAASMARPGGKSNYARKRAWCKRNGMWGFDVPEPKPWRTKS